MFHLGAEQVGRQVSRDCRERRPPLPPPTGAPSKCHRVNTITGEAWLYNAAELYDSSTFGRKNFVGLSGKLPTSDRTAPTSRKAARRACQKSGRVPGKFRPESSGAIVVPLLPS